MFYLSSHWENSEKFYEVTQWVCYGLPNLTILTIIKINLILYGSKTISWSLNRIGIINIKFSQHDSSPSCILRWTNPKHAWIIAKSLSFLGNKFWENSAHQIMLILQTIVWTINEDILLCRVPMKIDESFWPLCLSNSTDEIYLWVFVRKMKATVQISPHNTCPEIS